MDERATETASCPNCTATAMKPFFSIDAAPGNSCILCGNKDAAAAYPRGDIQLSFCETCGFVSNTRFNPALTEYSQRYEETQGYSPTFSRFSRKLAAVLVERHDLHKKRIIEIGCGKGDFLIELCQQGDNQGVGFDPAFVEARCANPNPARIAFIRDFYSEQYAGLEADFICCKMTIEHIHQTAAFIGMIAKTMDTSDAILFFQAPNAERIFQDCAFEDIYYEHCSYFTPASFAYLFRANGFEVLRAETVYDNQYLTIEARRSASNAAPATPDHIAGLRSCTAAFRQTYVRKTRWWRNRIREITNAGCRIAVWGSGSKAVAFLESVDPENAIEYAVDINPHRWGAFMPGSGREIVAPEFLADYRPEAVVIMNPIYRGEIMEYLRAMNLDTEALSL